MLFEDNGVVWQALEDLAQLTGRLLDDIQIGNDDNDAPQTACVILCQVLVVMSDMVKREGNGSERLPAPCGDGERENATIGGGFLLAGGEYFRADVHDCIRCIL